MHPMETTSAYHQLRTTIRVGSPASKYMSLLHASEFKHPVTMKKSHHLKKCEQLSQLYRITGPSNALMSNEEEKINISNLFPLHLRGKGPSIIEQTPASLPLPLPSSMLMQTCRRKERGVLNNATTFHQTAQEVLQRGAGWKKESSLKRRTTAPAEWK